MKKLLFISLVIIGFISSCYYDKEDTLYPNKSTCDTTAVTYNGVVKNIMSQHCNGCHDASIHNGNVITDSYSNLVSAVKNRNLICCIEWKGCKNMPTTGVKISDCKIQQMKIWVSNNFPQ